ncbi:MAG: hypothetical protein AAB568_02785, partial [Patescibacteria group bacterium]
ISNPAQPLFKKKIVPDASAGILLGGPRALAIVNDLVYVVSQNSQSLEVFRSSGDALVPVGKIVQNAAPNNMTPLALAVAGNYAYVVSTNPDNALYVFNVANPADIRLTAVWRDADFAWPRDVVVFGNFAYLISSDYSGNHRLGILDISKPSQPAISGRLDVPDALRKVAVQGNYVYAVSTGDFHVIDVSSATLPILKSSVIAGLSVSSPSSISLDGNYAYVTDSSAKKLFIINISNPLQPSLAGSIADGASGAKMPQPGDVVVSGEYAYVVSEPTAGNLEVVRIFESQDRGKPHQDLHTNNLNLETLSGGEHVWAQTTSGNKTVVDDALLYIKLTNPRVLEKWPDCNAACVNAELGAQFNVALSPTHANTQNVILCDISGPTADCSGANLATAISLRKQTIVNDTLVIAHPDLVANSYYRVIFAGLKSANGIEMDQTMGTSTLNYRAGDPNCLSNLTCDSHSWTLRTKADVNKCAVSSVEVQPAESVVRWVGAQAGYFSIPRGAKDACSPFGQRLNAWDYGWAWTSAPMAVATVSQFDSTSTASNLCNSACVRSGQTAWGTAPLCGNTVVEAGEDCDPPSATCTAQCLDNPKVNLGTLACAGDQNKDCCGNSIVEANEDCDAGVTNGQAGIGCTNRCLSIGTPISRNKCQAAINAGITCDLSKAINVCGDGVKEPDEECDAGVNNGKDGFGCTPNCLKAAKAYGTTASKCGNNIVENSNNEECDGERACTRDCQNAGASLEYGSFCGDGVFGWGEDAVCDLAATGDGKIDPWQLATAVGNGSVNPVTKQQIADITATAPTNQSGAAKFILQCGYEPLDAPCPVATDAAKGVGADSCCYVRPKATVLQPAVSPNTCPNTAIKIEFTDLMDQASFTDKLTGEYNIALATLTFDAPSCPVGYRQVARDQPPQNFWQKTLSFGRRLFGLPARADVYCQGQTDYTLSFVFVTSTPSTTVTLNLKEPLAFSKGYRIVLMPGIKTAKGVSLQPSIALAGLTNFTTKNSLCKIEKVTLDPQTWLFSTLGNDTSDDAALTATADKEIKDIDKVFTAAAYYLDKSVSDSPLQELQPLPGIYDWNYTWSVDENTIVAPGRVIPDAYNKNSSQEFVAQNKNGLTQLGATVIDSNMATFAATGTVQVFICNKPWPDDVMHYYGLGWADIYTVTDEGRGWNNFKLMYCRDAGKENDASDDLPELRPPAPLLHQNSDGSADSSGIFKEFFMTFDAPDGANVKVDRDSIGIRIYPNTQHLTLLDWYNSQPNIVKGVPVPVKVGSYDALQEGRTFYISGLNIVNNPTGIQFSIYSNVFV